MNYLLLCLALLKRGAGVDIPKVLDVLTAVVGTFPQRRAWAQLPKGGAAGKVAGSAVRMDELLKMLDNEHKLVDLLVTEMLRYKTDIAEKYRNELKADENTLISSTGAGPISASSGGTSGGSGATGASGGGARISHSDHVRTRLRFLGFVLEYSDLVLTSSQLNSLFDSYVTGALTRTESTTFLRWLDRASLPKTCKNKKYCPAHCCADAPILLSFVLITGRVVLCCVVGCRDFESFDDETSESVFLTKICKIAPAQFDESAFKCFQQFFLSVQVKAGIITRYDQLKEIESTKLASSGRKELEFKHYKELWDKLMAVPEGSGSGSGSSGGGGGGSSSVVINSAINLIIRLHSQLSKPLRNHVREIRSAFLGQTIKTLRDMLAPSAGVQSISWDHVYRVLLLLERYVAGDLDRESVDRVIEPKQLQVLFTLRVSPWRFARRIH